MGEVPLPQDHVDTLTWTLGGESGPCACAECWGHVPIWRYVQLIESAWRRGPPGVRGAELPDFVWVALTASRLRLLSWRYAAPGLVGGVVGLRKLAAAAGWNPGQIYEIAMRGLARSRRFAPPSGG
jgi:hypothetical protein